MSCGDYGGKAASTIAAPIDLDIEPNDGDKMKPTAMETATGDGSRKRRPYKKSRQGCRNCKLRRVKCDEAKPHCLRCRDYGVLCNFEPKAIDLQLSSKSVLGRVAEGCIELDFRQASTRSLMPAVASSDANVTVDMDSKSLEMLDRFSTRTIRLMGTPEAVNVWKEGLVAFAFKVPFLLHGILATTAIHDRYLSTPFSGQRSAEEIYHRGQCVELFSRKLSAPIEASDRDPLWAVAALLSIVSFASFDAAAPQDAWPLRKPDPSDLEWMKLTEGKLIIWNLTDPLRPGSMFRGMANEYAEMHSPLPHTGVDGMAPSLIYLCGLDTSSTLDDSPFFAVAHVLARLQRLSEEETTFTRVLSFLGHMRPSFKALLQQKDPIALLLLALWYAKAHHKVWWIERRAQIEYESIYLYLQQYHGHHVRIRELLPRLPSSIRPLLI